MDIIIAYRVGSGPLNFVMDDGEVAMFSSAKSAEHFVDNNKLFQSGQAEYQVIEIEI